MLGVLLCWWLHKLNVLRHLVHSITTTTLLLIQEILITVQRIIAHGHDQQPIWPLQVPLLLYIAVTTMLAPPGLMHHSLVCIPLLHVAVATAAVLLIQWCTCSAELVLLELCCSGDVAVVWQQYG